MTDAEQDARYALLASLPPGAASEVLVTALENAAGDVWAEQMNLIIDRIAARMPDAATRIRAAYDAAVEQPL